MINKISGEIVVSHGVSFIVEADSKRYFCSTRGKKVSYVCGDLVEISIQNGEQAVIESHLPRKTLLYRQDVWRSKLIAANVSRVLIVSAATPTPSEEFLNRALLAAEVAGIVPIIVINKSDLPETAAYLAKMRPYQELGYRCLILSAFTDVMPLREAISGETSLLLGQSGMGKSTLLNALLPEAKARIGEISNALDSGRHTTTNAELYKLDKNTKLIDSPGLQEFGLKHVKAEDLLYFFPEMRQFIGKCRFHNCQHNKEPDCAIKSACAEGFICVSRLGFLQRLRQELSQEAKY